VIIKWENLRGGGSRSDILRTSIPVMRGIIMSSRIMSYAAFYFSRASMPSTATSTMNPDKDKTLL